MPSWQCSPGDAATLIYYPFDNVKGTEGDGVFTLMLSLLVILLCLALLFVGGRRFAFSVILLGGLVVGLAVLNISDPDRIVDNERLISESSASVENGLYGTLIGGLVMVAGGGLATLGGSAFRQPGRLFARFKHGESEDLEIIFTPSGMMIARLLADREVIVAVTDWERAQLELKGANVPFEVLDGIYARAAAELAGNEP